MMAKMMGRLPDMAKPIGPGEKITRAKRRTKLVYMMGAALFGAMLPGVLTLLNRNPAATGKAGISFTSMTLDPAVSIGLAIILALVLVAVPIWMFRKVDELAVRQNLWAMCAGWFAMLGGFPVWQALAAGGWAEQPHAAGIFVLGYLVTMITFVIVKWRS